MKNIHILPTDKPSRLFIIDKSILLLSKPPYLSFSTVGGRVHKIEGEELYQPQNLYITNSEEIKAEDKWVYNIHWNEPQKIEENWILKILNESSNTFKIILATDQDLIKDGVQAIDDEFLEWLVKNPSCEEVKITTYGDYLSLHHSDSFHGVYKIIIPQEEPKQEVGKAFYESADKVIVVEKQETLEEAAERILFENTKNVEIRYSGERYSVIKSMIDLVKWQQEQDKNKYSEEEVKKLLIRCKDRFSGSELHDYTSDETVIEYFFAPKT